MAHSDRPFARWRGLEALVHDAVEATTDLVWEGHEAAHRGVWRVTDRLEGLARPVRAVGGAVLLGTAGTLGTVRAVNRVVQKLTDLALDATVSVEPGPEGPALPIRSDVMGTPAWIADAALAAVNAAVGDHLSATGNGLDVGLTLRLGDRYVDPADPGPLPEAIVVLVHGLATTEWSWALDAEAYHGDPTATFGTMLDRDTGLTPIFVRYNTGRRVVENGRALAEALERLLEGGEVRRIVLLGHSMGGLVSRSACHTASEQGHRWLSALDLVICLGTPHQGAPLARFGETAAAGLGAVDLPATRILARILAGRSAGIRDLEHGDVGDLARDPDATADPATRVVPLLDGVTYAFLSATIHADPEHAVSRWAGDLLVQVGSASGPRFHGSFPIHTGTFGGVLHHQLQCHPEVYAQVRSLVSADRRRGEVEPVG